MILLFARTVLFAIALGAVGLGGTIVLSQGDVLSMLFIGLGYIVVGIYLAYLVVWRAETIRPAGSGNSGRTWALSGTFDSGDGGDGVG